MQVAEIDTFVLFLDFRLRVDEEPTHVGEEEAAPGVVRVRVGVDVLVVDAVVSGPVIGVILQGEGLEHYQDELERQLGLVSLAGPEAMAAGGHALKSDDEEEPAWKSKKTEFRSYLSRFAEFFVVV